MPRNCFSATCPIPWGPRFSPPDRRRGEAGVARNPGITVLKWQLARGAEQPGTWGNPLAGSPLGSRTRRGPASHRPPRGVLALHPCMPTPLRGPRRRAPQFSSFLSPNPSTLRAEAPAPWLARRGSGALAGPEPPPLSGAPPPQLRPRCVIGCPAPRPRL